MLGLTGGVVLRYGLLYGPGTWYDRGGSQYESAAAGTVTATTDWTSFVHVDDAADATVLALDWPAGVITIVDDEPARAADWAPVLITAAGGTPTTDRDPGRGPWSLERQGPGPRLDPGSPQLAYRPLRVVIPVRLTPANGSDAASFAALRAEHADELDPYSTLERLPSAADLARAFDSDQPALLARADDEPLGYGVVHAWVEGDGTEVRLLDVWAVPGERRTRIEAELWTALESAVRDRTDPSLRVVLGANSRDTEPDRTALLQRLGYRPTFDMVELELTDRPPRTPLPVGTTLRGATPGDADAVAAAARPGLGRAAVLHATGRGRGARLAGRRRPGPLPARRGRPRPDRARVGRDHRRAGRGR